MIDKIKDEASEIYAFSKRNYRQIVVICLTVFFLVLNRYHPITLEWLGSLLYYMLLPILVIIILLRRNPLDYGLRIGNWRLWGWYVGITAIVAVPVLYAASRFSQLSDYYITESFVMWRYSLEMAAYLFGWEFLFRGFLLFGLKEKLQEASILVQMLPFVLLHLLKPELETISTILMGIYFGYVVYRGNSFWPAYIMHLLINISFALYVNLL